MATIKDYQLEGTVPHKLTKTEIKELIAKDKGYMIIKIGYNKIIVPYDDGLAIMKHLERAEEIEGYDDHKIRPPKHDYITSQFIPQSRYLQCKMAVLLDVEPDDIVF